MLDPLSHLNTLNQFGQSLTVRPIQVPYAISNIVLQHQAHVQFAVVTVRGCHKEPMAAAMQQLLGVYALTYFHKNQDLQTRI